MRVSSAQGYHGSRQAQRFQLQRVEISGIPGLQGCRILRPRGSKVPRLQGSRNPRLQVSTVSKLQGSGIIGSRALQGSKVAMSRGKVPSLHHDPKDAGFQGFRLNLRLKGSKILGFQGSRVPGFQDLSLQVFQGSTGRICRTFIKQRKMQTNKTKFKQNLQVLLTRF